MSSDLKIVVAGPSGVGKSTAVRSVGNHDRRCNATEVLSRSDHRPVTAGLDYAEVSIDSSLRLRLFGVPGESRFSHMYTIVSHAAAGLIVLVDNSAADPVADCMAEIERYRRNEPNLPVVVGITRSEICSEPGIGDYGDAFSRCGMTVPMMTADPRQRDDLLSLLDLLMIEIEDCNSPSADFHARREAYQ